MGSQPTDIVTLVDKVSQTSAMQNLAPPLQMALVLGAMALLTTSLVSVTAFTRIVIVLSFVRRALTTQEIPPNSVVMGMALFLTAFVMGPTFDRITAVALVPYLDKASTGPVAWEAGVHELRAYMLKQTRRQDVATMISIANIPNPQTAEDTPTRVLIPAYMISELKTAFIMGFCIYIPFLLIDLVVSTLLMAMGMMMMPPAMVSTPLKILLFVLVDGWQLITRALSVSFI